MAITCLRAIIRLKGRPGSVSIDTFTVAVTDTGGVAVRSNVDIGAYVMPPPVERGQ